MEGEASSACPAGHQGFEEISPGIRVCLTNDTPPRVRTVWVQDATDREFVPHPLPPPWLAVVLAQRLWDMKREERLQTRIDQLRTGLGELAQLVATRGTGHLSAAEIIYAIHDILRDRATPKEQP